MAEYIERGSAISLIEEKQKALCPVGRYGRHYVYGSDRETYDAWEEIIETLEAAPAADVSPVVHGLWILDSSDEYADHYHCDRCGVQIDLCNEVYTEPKPNYCLNCGAKMQGYDIERAGAKMDEEAPDGN